MIYEQAVNYIHNLPPRKWRAGLDRMQALLVKAGLLNTIHPGTCPNYIHIAGTNGKGSVTAFIHKILTDQKYNTGAFHSPHVYTIRERIQSNGNLISKTDFAELVAQFRDPAEAMERTEYGLVTEFEFKTALGLAHWQKVNCEFVALEVGLGGRFDATNIVHSAISVITNIALDHTHILGNTTKEIAYEKAGIIKPKTPVIIGNLDPDAAQAILEIAEQNCSPVWKYGSDFYLEKKDNSYSLITPKSTYHHLSPGPKGLHQAENMAVALATLDYLDLIKDEQILKNSLENTQLPGRYEVKNLGETQIILDGAHNPNSAEKLVETLKSRKNLKPLVMITGILKGHDHFNFYQYFEGFIESIYTANLQTFRTMQSSDLAADLTKYFPKVASQDKAEECFVKALEEAKSLGADILVTGSFYLVGEIGNIVDRLNQKKESVA